MKIFMEAGMHGFITIRVINDKGEIDHFMGKRCDDYMPVFGCELDDNEEKRLIDWLNNE